MKLENEFTVPVPLEEVWPALLDIEQVATCLPGAAIEPSPEDGVFRGRMKIKLGPVTTVYEGSAQLQDVDDDTHTASIAVSAKEAKGQGTASATITNRLNAIDAGTRVVVETDLAITGRQAQFGRGIMSDVANRMMGQFAERFEQQLRAGGGQSRDPAASAAATNDEHVPSAPVPEPDALDLGNVLVATPTVRAALGVGVLVLLVAIFFAGRRTRK